MKLIELAKALLNLPKTLESIDQRLRALENSPQTFTWPSSGTGIATFPNYKYVQPECSGGCEFPSHYVGDFVPCMKCGRTIPSLRTIITCCAQPGSDPIVS
jgi:hypothetical protein